MREVNVKGQVGTDPVEKGKVKADIKANPMDTVKKRFPGYSVSTDKNRGGFKLTSMKSGASFNLKTGKNPEYDAQEDKKEIAKAIKEIKS